MNRAGPPSILVTGAAGFIGAHVCVALRHAGFDVQGCDALFDDDPDLQLRRDRAAALLAPAGIALHRADLASPADAQHVLGARPWRCVIHLAAKPGVRDSVRAPLSYVGPNLVAFAQVLEGCRRHGVAHLMYASSSSVYGRRSEAPFRENERCDEPSSFYAATKVANEAMAHATSVVHGLPVTGLRFFTVYGPWGRPDMAYWRFAQDILAGRTLTLYGRGELKRDFTFVDDVVDAIVRLVHRGPATDGRPEVLNVGHRQPVSVSAFVDALERALGLKARVRLAEMPPGDVPLTCADPSALLRAIGPLPWRATPLDQGLNAFVDWLRRYEPSRESVVRAA